MQSEMIRVELTFAEFCQVQHALEQRSETSTAALAALVGLPLEFMHRSAEHLATTNRALAKLQRSLHTRRDDVRARPQDAAATA